MSEKKKNAATEEVKEEARKLSEEELEKVNGGIKTTTLWLQYGPLAQPKAVSIP